MSVSSVVLDASALLAMLNGEPGADQVTGSLTAGAAVSAVNLSEVVARLARVGMPTELIRGIIDPLGLEIVPFDADLAYAAGSIAELTKRAGLSLGDRACLALAQQLDVTAMTADRAWSDLQLGIRVQVIR